MRIEPAITGILCFQRLNLTIFHSKFTFIRHDLVMFISHLRVHDEREKSDKSRRLKENGVEKRVNYFHDSLTMLYFFQRSESCRTLM